MKSQIFALALFAFILVTNQSTVAANPLQAEEEFSTNAVVRVKRSCPPVDLNIMGIIIKVPCELACSKKGLKADCSTGICRCVYIPD